MFTTWNNAQKEQEKLLIFYVLALKKWRQNYFLVMWFIWTLGYYNQTKLIELMK